MSQPISAVVGTVALVIAYILTSDPYLGAGVGLVAGAGVYGMGRF